MCVCVRALWKFWEWNKEEVRTRGSSGNAAAFLLVLPFRSTCICWRRVTVTFWKSDIRTEPMRSPPLRRLSEEVSKLWNIYLESSFLPVTKFSHVKLRVFLLIYIDFSLENNKFPICSTFCTCTTLQSKITHSSPPLIFTVFTLMSSRIQLAKYLHPTLHFSSMTVNILTLLVLEPNMRPSARIIIFVVRIC